MTKIKRSRKPTAEDAYVWAREEAIALVERIRERLEDLPAPDSLERAVNWADSGTVAEANARLRAVLAFLDGTER